MAVEEIPTNQPDGEEPVREKPGKKRVGRPSDITPEKLSQLEGAFANGCNDQEACFLADIWPASFYAYQKRHPEFLERKKALKTRPVIIARKSVNDAMKDDGWLALKYLEKKRPDEFGEKPPTIPAVSVTISFEKKIQNYVDENPDAKTHLLKISKFLREPDGPEQAHA